MTGERTSRSDDGKDSQATTQRSQRSSSDRSNSRRRRSRTADSKAIRETLTTVRRRVRKFKKDHLGARSEFDFAQCSKCLDEEILEGWKMGKDDVKDYEDFLHYTLRKEIDEDIMASDEYIDLMSIAKRADDFETLVPDAKRRLLNCLNKHVYKSCISLKEMTGNEIIIAVSEYENNIHTYITNIEAKTDELDQNYSEYKKFLRPFSLFVMEGKEHTTCMNTVCNNLLEMCKLVEDWAKEDEEYPDKLDEEYEANKKVRENIQQSLDQTQAKKRDNLKIIDKIKKSETRAGKGYSEHRKEKQKFKLRKEQLERKKHMVEEKIEKKRDERDRLKEERESEPKSPRGSDDFLQRLEKVEFEIERLEKDRKTTDRQMRRVEKELKPANERTYEHKVDGVTHRHRREDLEKENLKLDDEMASLKERIANVNATNETLVKVREMKLSAEAYRKNMREKQKQEALQLGGKKELDEACKYAAPVIGKDWPRVYLSLPFDPPRDLEKRNKDVDILDHIFARNDIPDDEQAWKSLAKWRTFNRRGNVEELIDALRITKKRHLAEELEDMFVKKEEVY